MSEQRISKIVRTLKNSCIEDIYLALVELRTRFSPDDAVTMSDLGVMKLVVPFIENPKLSSVSLSIIANACLHASLRTDVLRNDGVKCLVRVMKTIANDAIQNRACRALGNIALCQEGITSVHKYKAVPHIVNLLSTTDDKNAKITAVRTLRILGTGRANCSLIVSEKGVCAISELLNSEDTDVIQCAVKAVASLTQQCSVDCAEQLQDADGLNSLVKLFVHSEKSIRDNALICLENLSGQAVIRPELGRAGAIPLFITVANSSSEYKDIKSAMLSLCFCCKEPLNRGIIEKSNGLELLLKILKDEKFSEVHENIVLALLYFRYENKSLDALIELGLIKIFTMHLRNYIERNKPQFSECSEELHRRKKPKFTPLDTENFMDCDVEEVEMSSKKSVEQNATDVKESISHSESCWILDVTPTSMEETAVDTERDCTFSIHSPSYQVFKTSDKHVNGTGSYCDSVYVNFCSPAASVYGSRSSPDRISVDFNVHSPSSCSSGPYSPAFSSAEEASDTSVCFSPTLGSPVSDSSENCDVTLDFVTFSDEENDTDMANFDLIDSDCSKPEQSNLVDKTNKRPLKLDESMVFKEPPSPLENQKRGRPKFSGRKHQLELSSCSKQICSLLKQDSKATEKNHLVSYIIFLLSHLSKMLKFSSKIAEKACVDTLMDYLILLPEPDSKVHRILLRLLKNLECFDKLIYFNFFGMLDEKLELCLDASCCSRCSKLAEMRMTLKDNGYIVAKSSYGIGTLQHVLLTGSVKAQLNSIYTFSSLVKEKSCLKKLLIDADGLSFMLEFLTSQDDDVFEVAAVSISRIYRWLSKRPRCVRKMPWWREKVNESTDQHFCQYINCSHDVSFIVDSKQVVKASRSIVCEKSDFFQALLQGHFSEAHESDVILGDISHIALLITFHFLHGCSEDSCNFLKNIEFDVLLELLGVCDKYLISEFKHLVERQLLNIMEMDKAPKIHMYSKMYNFPILARHALHFVLLAGESEKKALLKCLHDMLDSSDALDDIKHSIKDMLPGSRDLPLYKRQNSDKS